MWSNRLNCMRINPNYAKERTLVALDNYWNSYNTFITKYNYLYASRYNNVAFPYNNKIIWTYIIMHINKEAFNILDNSDLMKLTNIQQNMDDIKDDIEYLYHTIRNRILAL